MTNTESAGATRATAPRSSTSRQPRASRAVQPRHTPAPARATTPATPAVSAPSSRQRPTIADVFDAQRVIGPYINATPLLTSHTFSQMTGAEVYLKAENLQRSGAYKLRGATYKLSRLTSEERARGVVAASAGNHAQAVALAASRLGIRCTIVMPTGAPLAKITATRGYGAEVVLHGANYDAAYEHAHALCEEAGAVFIHAFDDPDIIAGQGTIGLELLAALPDVEAIIVGIGGGGLISGIATAVKAEHPAVRIIGVQASGAASMRAALDAGHLVTLDAVHTIADGIATRQAGSLTYAIVRDLVDDVITVDDDEIVRAVLLLLERCKLLVEGAGAASVAALLSGRLALTGRKTVALLSGGNVDINMVDRFIQHGLAAQGRYLVLHTTLLDRPGQLSGLLATIAEQGVNVLDIEHRRAGPHLAIQQAAVTLTLETRDRAHCDQLIALLRSQGYPVTET